MCVCVGVAMHNPDLLKFPGGRGMTFWWFCDGDSIWGSGLWKLCLAEMGISDTEKRRVLLDLCVVLRIKK